MFANVVPALSPFFSVEEDKTVQLAIVGQPTPKARGRAVLKKTAIRIYNASQAKERKFSGVVKGLMGGLLTTHKTYFHDKFLEVCIVFAYPRPLCHYHGGRRAEEALKANVPRFPRHGDLDNLSKFVLDALNGVLFDDDSQVVFLHTKKLWVPDHQSVGSTTVRVSVIEF